MGNEAREPIFDPLERVFERWCERESVLINGRAGNFLPDLTYRWVMNEIGGFCAIAEGYCTARCTTPHVSDSNLDDFGVSFRNLSEIEQALVIVGHYGKKTEWEVFLDSQKLHCRNAEKILKTAWLRLWLDCWKREVF